MTEQKKKELSNAIAFVNAKYGWNCKYQYDEGDYVTYKTPYIRYEQFNGTWFVDGESGRMADWKFLDLAKSVGWKNEMKTDKWIECSLEEATGLQNSEGGVMTEETRRELEEAQKDADEAKQSLYERAKASGAFRYKWTTELPTKPGFYWAKWDAGWDNKIEPIQIFMCRKCKKLGAFAFGANPDECISLDRFESFQGPIKPFGEGE